jgi:REP element-mobilizing transposase RayT
MNTTVRARRHRLRTQLYDGTTTSFTCNIQRYQDLLSRQPISAMLSSLLIECCHDHDCRMNVLVIMPDHLHCIIGAHTPNGNPIKAMRRFKQRSGYRMLRLDPPVKWRNGFYDSVLRDEASLRRHLIYCLENPVRAGLVRSWKDYPYQYSEVYPLEGWDDLLVPDRSSREMR